MKDSARMAEAMKTKQDLRSEATRQRLTAAARGLFAERGYASVGTEQIVQAAGVTRGALYHQFRDKADLFAAAAETIHAEIAERITAGARADGPVDPMIALHAGVRRFLEVCADPAVERILFLDAPAVLGWQAWRDMADRYGLGLLQQGIQAGIDAGAITPQPVVPLAHALLGAVSECAIYIARAEDPEAARRECTAVLQQLLDGLTSRARKRTQE
jgi:AcrR family transcriptional regulator